MAAGERKRPWYLVLALFVALLFGARGASGGWDKILFYQEPVNPEAKARGISDDAERAAVVARTESYLRTLDAAKARGWPLAVAAFLLGAATCWYTVLAFLGNSGARAALIQLILAQAALGLLSDWVMRDVNDSELRLKEALGVALMRESDIVREDRAHADDYVRGVGVIVRLQNPIALALQSLGSAFVVVALTRRRSREYFDSAAAALGGR